MVSAAQGNMSYLSDFEELNRGYVAFGSNPKGVFQLLALDLMLPWSLKKNTKCLLLPVKILVLP
nr:hypothetical protein [Tanacetum cinerariifolium]